MGESEDELLMGLCTDGAVHVLNADMSKSECPAGLGLSGECVDCAGVEPALCPDCAVILAAKLGPDDGAKMLQTIFAGELP